MTDPPAVLLAGFDVWPGPSAWARRMTEGVRASANRHRVLTLSLRSQALAHTESLFGARVLRVPPGPGSLLEQVEAFGRAVQRQLDSDAHVLVHTADPLVGAAVLGHPRRPALVYEARRLPSSELPLLLGRGRDAAVLEQALRRWERQCLTLADAVLVTTQTPRRGDTGRWSPRRGAPGARRGRARAAPSAAAGTVAHPTRRLGPVERRTPRARRRAPRARPRCAPPSRPAPEQAVGRGGPAGGERRGEVGRGDVGASWRAPRQLGRRRGPLGDSGEMPGHRRCSPTRWKHTPGGGRCWPRTRRRPGRIFPRAAPSSFPARTARRWGRRSRRSRRARTSSRSQGQRRARMWNDDMMGRGCEVLLRDLYRGHGAAPASWPPVSGAWRPSVPAGWSGTPGLPGERAPEGTDPGTPSGGFG